MESWDALGWKGPVRPPCSNPCCRQGHLPPAQVAHSHTKPGLECFQGGGIHSLTGQHAPLSHCPHSKEFLPNSFSQDECFGHDRNQRVICPRLPQPTSLFSPCFPPPCSFEGGEQTARHSPAVKPPRLCDAALHSSMSLPTHTAVRHPLPTAEKPRAALCVPAAPRPSRLPTEPTPGSALTHEHGLPVHSRSVLVQRQGEGGELLGAAAPALRSRRRNSPRRRRRPPPARPTNT